MDAYMSTTLEYGTARSMGRGTVAFDTICTCVMSGVVAPQTYHYTLHNQHVSYLQSALEMPSQLA